MLLERRAQMFLPKANRLYLFKAGDVCEDITGGYVAINYRDTINRGGTNTAAPILTIDESAGTMQIPVPNTARRIGTVFTNNKIDVTDYSYLCVDLFWTLRNGANTEHTNVGFIIGFSTTFENLYTVINLYHQWIAPAQQNFDGILKLDISNITGDVYFLSEWWRFWDSARPTDCYSLIRNLWLE